MKQNFSFLSKGSFQKNHLIIEQAKVLIKKFETLIEMSADDVKNVI